MPRIEEIDACLPQTQCGRCGYLRCLDYAAAVASGSADIDQCPPGGEYTTVALAGLLSVESKPPDPAYGSYRPGMAALIDEAACIGCVLCIKACPVDAIVGAARLMHTVIENECTGCELCLPVCPTDCIGMIPPRHFPAGRPSPWAGFTLEQVEKARRRSAARLLRLQRRNEARRRRRRQLKRTQMQEEIRAAVARVRARRARGEG